MGKKDIESMNTLYESLKKLLDDIQDNDNFKRAKILMQSKEMYDVTSEFLDDAIKGKTDIPEIRIKLLKVILELCNSIYNYSGSNTGLSDSDYDILFEYYKDISRDDSIVTESLVSSNNVANHKYISLRGTLDKIYKITDEDILKNKSQKSLDDWVKQTERRCLESSGELLDIYDCEVIVMPKFDGLSCIFECDKNGKLLRALTRGDTVRNEAQDITHIFKDMYEGPIKDAFYPYGVKTEIMMKDEDLEKFNKDSGRTYKNTRSAVSAILNSDEENDNSKYLHIVPLRYSFLINGEESEQELSPEVYNYPYLKCKLNEVDKIHNFAINHKNVNPGLRCDGAVIQILDKDIQKYLGRENQRQKYEVAFKFTEETSYSKVEDIEFTTGLFGRINPVVIFKPVKMKGNTINRASLGSYSRFKELELCKDDVIKISYDIIPYVTFDTEDFKCIRSGKKVIKEPLICNDCGNTLEESESGDILYCNNDECPSRQKGKILNYCKKMNISNISYATIEDFYREGYLNDITDLYLLKDYKDEISKINGYGVNKITNIVNEIESHKEVTPSVLLGSLGIEGISTKSFENILMYIDMDNMIGLCKDNNYDYFTTIPGIKDKTSKKLVKGINKSKDLIKFLRKTLTILKEPIRNKGNFSVVFTKVRDEEKEQFIRDCGGEVSESVTKNTSLVVVPLQGIRSSKVSKAERYGIPVIPIGELENYIKSNF